MIEMRRLKNVVIFIQKILSFVLSRNIVAVPFKFRAKLICYFAFESASSFFADYLNILQLAYDIHLNNDKLLNNQLFNHHIDKLQVFECYHMFLNYFYCLIKKSFYVDHNITIFCFYRLKIISFRIFLTILICK